LTFKNGDDLTLGIWNPVTGKGPTSCIDIVVGGAATSCPTVAPIAAPVLSPAAGTYSTAQTVTMTSPTAGTYIEYTVNGSGPPTNWTRYTAPVSVAANETIEAVAIAANDTEGPVTVAAYAIAAAAATPTFSMASGTYTAAQSVTLTDATAGAVIYYTTNGTAPTTASTKYSGAIAVSATETIKAIAVATGYAASAVASASYTIVPMAAAPAFSSPGGLYATGLFVSLTDATSGATIYYTTNGTVPTTASTKYTAPITVMANETIEAIAVETGDTNSSVATAAYQIAGSPYALALPASAIGTTAATLNAVVNPGALTGTYVFHYGTSSSALTLSTAATSIGPWTEAEQVSAPLTGLAAKTTYYFQVVVTTNGGVSSGFVQSFTTE